MWSLFSKRCCWYIVYSLVCCSQSVSLCFIVLKRNGMTHSWTLSYIMTSPLFGFCAVDTVYCFIIYSCSATHLDWKTLDLYSLTCTWIKVEPLIAEAIFFHIVCTFSASHRSHVGAVLTSSGGSLEGFKAYPVFKEIEKHLQEVHQHVVINKSSSHTLISILCVWFWDISIFSSN